MIFQQFADGSEGWCMIDILLLAELPSIFYIPVWTEWFITTKESKSAEGGKRTEGGKSAEGSEIVIEFAF